MGGVGAGDLGSRVGEEKGVCGLVLVGCAVEFLEGLHYAGFACCAP